MRSILTTLALLVLLVPATAAEWTGGRETLPPAVQTLVPPRAAETAPLTTAQACCKVCRKGKACGNSCINRAYRCHQPPGCACDAQ